MRVAEPVQAARTSAREAHMKANVGVSFCFWWYGTLTDAALHLVLKVYR
jgi:hypothetical protein